MSDVTRALIGMAGYSVTTLLEELATRGGQFSSFLVLALATVIVCATPAWSFCAASCNA